MQKTVATILEEKGHEILQIGPEAPVFEALEVITVEPARTVTECMELMTERRFRHLPVVVDGELTGVISIGDVVKAVISEQRFLIEELEHYITGTP